MASYFVWSGATGLDDGSTWEDAAPSLAIDWGVTITPGTDQVYVRNTHSESQGVASAIIRGSTGEGTTLPVDIRCVVGADTGTTPGALSTGASVTTTGGQTLEIHENIYINGVDFISDNDIELARNSDSAVYLERCNFTIASVDDLFWGAVTQNGQTVYLKDCDVTFLGVTGGLRAQNAQFTWRGGTLINDVDFLFASVDGRPGPSATIEGVDLSVLTGSLVAPNTLAVNFEFLISRCVLGTGATLIGSIGNVDVPGVRITVAHCQIGTDADPAFQYLSASLRGFCSAVTATFRTGGASDGERTNPVSWDMDTTEGSNRTYPGHPLESGTIVGWTDGDGTTAHTYRIYFASGATQDNDEIWFELLGPNDLATTSFGVIRSTRVEPETASAAHTTDGVSTWTGADVGTKQFMEITYTPDKPGPISAIVYMVSDAGLDGHIFVDPKIYIDEP